MTKRLITYFLFAVLGALTLLLALNLAGFGPALVRYERVRVILPPQRHLQSPSLPNRPSSAPKPRVAVPAPPVAATAPAVTQPQAAVPAPAVSQPTTVINIYPPLPPAATQPMAPATPSVPPAKQAVAPPQELFQAPSAPTQAMPDVQATLPAPAPPIRTASAPHTSWITFQLNIGTSGGWGGYSAYGWTPGHEAVVCEPGHGCFRRWVGHPMPGPYWW